MDISSFLGGNFLTHLDLPQQPVVWTIANVSQQLVGTDQKIVIQFQQHQKGLGLNKINLRAVASGYGVNAAGWIGKALELYRDQTFFQGKQTPCIRVRIPAAAAPQAYPQQPPQLMAGPQVYQQPAMLQPQQAYQQPQPAAQQPAYQQPAAPQAAPQQPPGIVASPGAPPWGGL